MPNRGARAVLLALELLIGKNGLGAVLKIAGLSEWVEKPPADELDPGAPFIQLAMLYRALEELYGVRSARGLIRQANHDAFMRAWGSHSTLAAFHDAEFKSRALADRISLGYKTLSKVFSEISDLDLQIKEDEAVHTIQLSHCPDCIALHSEAPACTGILGFLEGALSAINPGTNYQIREVECKACGQGRCLYEISHSPEE